MNVSLSPYYSTNVNNKSLKQNKQNPSFCAGEATLTKTAKDNAGTIRNMLFAGTSALGLFLSNIFTSKSEKMEQKIDQMTADIKSAYENTDGNSNDFKAKTDKLNNFINRNVVTHYYQSFVQEAIEFLQANMASQPDGNNINARFEPFKDEKGNYSERWNNFISLVNLASKEAISSTNRDMDYYKFHNDIVVAGILMQYNQGGLSDAELYDGIYPYDGNIY